MLRPPLRVAVAVAALAFLACPGARRGPPPERFVPADARFAVVVPEVRRAARELAALHETLTGFPGAGELAGARGALTAQLGFDPLDADALASAGVDPRRGAAVAALDRQGPKGEPASPMLVVLPAADAPKLEGLFVRLARDRLGATERSAEVHGQISVVVLRRPGSPSTALAYSVVQHTAIVCAGAAGPAAVAEAAALKQAASLSGSQAWTTARRALGDGPAAIAFAPSTSRLLQGVWPLADGVAVGVSTGTGRLRASAAILLGAREPSFRALAAGGGAAALVSRLDHAAPIAGRWDGDPAALGKKLVPMLPEKERARLAKKGVDLERDFFAVIAPGAAVSLSLAPALELGGLTSDAARSDPLRLVEFEALLPVRDPDAAAAASERIARALDVKRAARSPHRSDAAIVATTPSGEIAWMVDRERARVIAAGGKPGRLDALVARLRSGEGFHPPTAAAADALKGGLGGAVLDVPRLVAAVRALPDEAFGTGPTGFVMRSVVDRVIDPAERLSAASLHADLAEGALVVSLEVEAREGGATP